MKKKRFLSCLTAFAVGLCGIVTPQLSAVSGAEFYASGQISEEFSPEKQAEEDLPCVDMRALLGDEKTKSDDCFIETDTAPDGTDGYYPKSGTMGDIIWEIDDSWTLRITGSGYVSSSPWWYYSDSIKSVSVGQGITGLPYNAFGNCDSLQSVYVYSGLNTVPAFAFSWCDALDSVSIPNTVTAISYGAFYYCRSLPNLTIPGSVSYIDTRLLFYGCESMTDIYVDSANQYYRDEGGVLYSHDMTELVAYPSAHSQNFTVPSTVTTIANNSFSDLGTLKVLKIPKSVQKIEDEAVVYWGSLTDIYYSGTQAQWEQITTSYFRSNIPGSVNIHFSGEGIPIDEAHFPDRYFRSFVLYGDDNYSAPDSDGDGFLSDEETAAAKELHIGSKGISDLTGIEYFTYLTGLYCENNRLTVLDVSSLADLAVLYCQGNQLTSLDLTGKDLLLLDCTGNSCYIGELSSPVFGLSALPGFDPERASGWTGAEYDSTAGELINISGKTITYNYDTGNGGIVSFTLTLTFSAPPAPKLKAAAGDECITLTWSAAEGAVKYAVCDTTDGSEVLISNKILDTTYTVTGLTNGQSRSYTVKTYANGKWSAASNTVSAVPVRTAPVSAAAAGDGSVTVSWDAVESAAKYAISSYDGSEFSLINNKIVGTSYTVSGLTNGKTYSFCVQAYANKKWSPLDKKYVVSATPKEIVLPPTVKATAGDSEVKLSWNAVPGAVKYAVTIASDGEQTVLSSKVTGTSYTASGLTNGRTYTFYVQTYSGSAWSAKSTAVSATPKEIVLPPTVKATAGDSEVTLSWNAVTGAVKYAVTIASDGEQKVLSNKITDTSYTASGLTNGKTYTFYVQTYSGSAWSAKSTAVTAAPKEIVLPPTVKATAGDGEVKLSWNAVPGAVKYAVTIASDGEQTVLSSKITGTSYTASGLTNGKTYTFYVQTYSGSAWSAKSTAVTATPKEIVLPPTVKATAGDSEVKLSWNAVPGAVKYAVTIVSDGEQTVLSSKVTGTSYTASGLTNGRTYTFYVQTYSGSAWSAKSTAVTAAPKEIVLPPTVKAKAGDGEVALSWNAVPGAVKYAVTIASDGEQTVLSSKITGTSYTASGLTNGKTYTFYVQTYSGSAWSAKSTAVSATPKEIVLPPTVKATAGDSEVKLSWNAVPGAVKYAVTIASDGEQTVLSSKITGTSYTASGLTNGRTYTFYVQTYSGSAWSAKSDPVTITFDLPEHTVKAVGVNCGVLLSWEKISNAVKYSVCIVQESGYEQLSNRVTGTTYLASGLTNGKTYSFTVFAYINSKWQIVNASQAVSAVPDQSIPAVTAAAGTDSVKLSWTAVPGASKYAVSKLVNGELILLSSSLTGTLYTDTGLIPQNTYTYLVQAFNGSKWSTNSLDYCVRVITG